jgi:glycosyltransferase involved in cell wall biosynthesis
MEKREIKVAYMGQVAPFEPEFYNEPGYGRPGSLAQLGFIEALHNTEMGLDRAWGFRPIAHWPKTKIQFEWIRRMVLPCGAKLTLLPLFNHLIMREISRFFIIAWLLIHWSLQRIGYSRVLVMYNLDEPNGLVWVRFLTWITHTKLVPVIYDLARMEMYGKSLIMHIREPDWLDRLHEKMIPLCDGLMPITDAIAHDFAPKMKYLRVDGGVGEAIVNNLPSLSVSTSDTFTIFYAGGITPWNRIDILLGYMDRNKDPQLRLWLAGGGRQEQMVKEAAARDGRITFFGFLGPKELNDLYGKADMLVTLRDLIDPGLKYHYPSKTFEMLAMGKPLVITNSQHAKQEYGKYCYVINECTLDEYSKAVDAIRVMTPEDRLIYGIRAREFVLASRRWRAWGKSIGKYLGELCDIDNRRNA